MMRALENYVGSRCVRGDGAGYPLATGEPLDHVVGKARRVEEAELHDIARLARDCAVMTQAVALSRWISDAGPRPVTPRQVLRKPDLPSAAEAIGVSLPMRLRTAADIPTLGC
jgi:hypothetical protein